MKDNPNFINVDIVQKSLNPEYGLKRRICVIKTPEEEEKMLNAYINIANNLLQWRNGQVLNPDLIPAFQWLIRWTYKTPEEHPEIDKTKGALIKGDVGCGKTFLMWVFAKALWFDKDKLGYYANGRNFPKMWLKLEDARTMASNYGRYAQQAIDYYSALPLLCIDDLGAESKLQSSYGNVLNIVEEILARRTDDNLLTFATTNLEDFSSVYKDARTISRMKRLFQPLVLNSSMDFSEVRAVDDERQKADQNEEPKQ